MSTGSEQVCAYIALGSNLENPLSQLGKAFAALDAITDSRCVQRSSLYLGPAMGEVEQPDYINAVAALVTCLPPRELLSCLQDIERSQGRVRGEVRWGPRTLDLDILLYGDRQYHDPQLTIPHPGLPLRNFVLFPLFEIAPDLVLPGPGSLRELVNRTPMAGLQRLENDREIQAS